MATAKNQSVDDYIAEYPIEIQNLLSRMRAIIKKAAPQAEEMISYNMPLYRFSIDKPLPMSLITKIVKLRMKENVARVKQKKRKKEKF